MKVRLHSLIAPYPPSNSPIPDADDHWRRCRRHHHHHCGIHRQVGPQVITPLPSAMDRRLYAYHLRPLHPM
jgi:hypothetical protein